VFDVNEQNWPMVEVTTTGAMTLADAHAYITMFDGYLDRAEPFAVMMIAADLDAAHGEGREEGVNPTLAKWAKANRDGMERWCRGMASVIPFEEPRAAYASRIAVAEKAFGYPLAVFADAEVATTWLRERLADAAIVTAPAD